MADGSSSVLQFSKFQVYRFTSNGHEPVISLAGSIDEAVNVFLVWRALRDIPELAFAVEPGWGASLSPTGQAHLAVARAQCTQSCVLGLYEAKDGWTLCDPAIGTDEG